MTLWRISRHAALDGAGGLWASGRWHSRGTPVVYCAQTPAAALLEVLVHIEIDLEDLPRSLRYLEIEAADEVPSETVEAVSLPRNWAANPAATRRLGDDWLQSGRSPLLTVPSVLAPATWNVLLNPRHAAAAAVRIVRTHDHTLDTRFKGASHH